MTIQSLAKSLLSRKVYIESDRTPGLKGWSKFEDLEEWERDLCREAHGDMLPEDWRYEFIIDALDVIAEFEGDEGDIGESFDESHDGMYCYTSQQTGWLHSRNDRQYYVDQATREFGSQRDVMSLVVMGMYMEAREVFESVLASLQKRVEELADEELNEEE